MDKIKEEEEKKEEVDSVAEPENRDQDHSNEEVRILADGDETIIEENN